MVDWRAAEQVIGSEPVFPQHFAVIGKYFAPVPNQPSPDFTVWIRKA